MRNEDQVRRVEILTALTALTALIDEKGAGVKGGYQGSTLRLEALGNCNFFGALPSCLPSAKSFRSCRAASAGLGWLIALARRQ